ncbi:hypothetical protein HOC01_04450 [archaeon]|jgi:hypothetical protein|nr:hypothetical protein [archaeon]MBT6697746.1 hypothetical protein [archaeon]
MAIKTFIQKINDNQVDDLVHSRFIRFSLGEFEREANLLKVMAKGAQVQTGYEYAPDLIFLALDMLGDSAKIEGEAVLVAAKADPTEDIKTAGFEIKTKKGKKYTLTFNQSAEELRSAVTLLAAKYAFLIPKFKCDESVKLKMKGSPPKPGSIKEKFCTLKVTKEHTETLLNTFLFDSEERKFKKAQIDHVFNIKDVKIPKEYENDFAKARLYAKKVGTIKRTITVDGNELSSTDIKLEA